MFSVRFSVRRRARRGRENFCCSRQSRCNLTVDIWDKESIGTAELKSFFSALLSAAILIPCTWHTLGSDIYSIAITNRQTWLAPEANCQCYSTRRRGHDDVITYYPFVRESTTCSQKLISYPSHWPAPLWSKWAYWIHGLMITWQLLTKAIPHLWCMGCVLWTRCRKWLR